MAVLHALHAVCLATATMAGEASLERSVRRGGGCFRHVRLVAGGSVSMRTRPVSSPHFLEAFPNALSPAACEAIVARFEADSRRIPSITAGSRTPTGRSGTMLVLTETMADWADVVRDVMAAVARNVAVYAERYPAVARLVDPARSFISYPLVERIDPGQGFGLHVDSGPMGTHDRILSTLLYLRDVPEGGFTQFPYQSIRVPPKAGLMLVFPPFWTHPHEGTTPLRGVKYNITNFVCVRERAPSLQPAGG